MSSKSLWAMSLSLISATTLRWRWTPPLTAAVMHFSATGLRALALASVVTSDSAAMSDATRLPSMAFWCAASPPSRRPLRGVPRMTASVLDAEREAPLVQALDHLVEGLLTEVSDGQKVLGRPFHELADGVDLGSLEAVAGPLGEVEVLDGE